MYETSQSDLLNINFDTSDFKQINNEFFIFRKRLPPVGDFEKSSFIKSDMIGDILKSPLKYYMKQFLDYFVNDYDSVKQCLNHLANKPSNDKLLVKSKVSSNNMYSSGIQPRSDEDENSLFDTYKSDRSTDGLYSYNSTPINSAQYQLNSDELGIYENMIGSSQLSSLSKMIDDEVYGHYFRASNYHSFYLDVTRLLIHKPSLASDLLLAPHIMLILLDYMIIPCYYSLVESMSINYKVHDIKKIMELSKTFPQELTKDIKYIVANLINESIANKSTHVYDKFKGGESSKDKITFHITTRLKNVPPTMDIIKNSVGEITEDDVGKLITITATVVLSGSLNVIEEERVLICKKCFHEFLSKCSPESYLYNWTHRCPNFIPGSKPRKPCDGNLFEKGKYFKRSDYQEIRCQSIFECDSSSGYMSVIPVVLRREIAGSCFPGDNVHICGFVRRRWDRLKIGEMCETELFLDAVNIEHVNWRSITGLNNYSCLKANLYEDYWKFNRDDEIHARNMILGSMCKDLLNLYNAKLGLLLTLIGGHNPESVVFERENRWSKYSTDGNKIRRTNRDELIDGIRKKSRGTRTQSHILLAGDPGTGKSHLLNYAAQISYRHVSVIGTNCSSVGLTCTMVKDGMETMLAAGALVLASGGICCIDEFSSIKNDDKSCLHEAMEQQVISVAKAGIKCTLNCQCSIVAATNFKSDKAKGFNNINNNLSSELDLEDDNKRLNVKNVNIPLPLLTRFDLILVFEDNLCDDLSICDFLFDDEVDQNLNQIQNNKIKNDMLIDWSSDNTIKNYIQFVRERIFPTISSSCKHLIGRYYSDLRNVAQESEYGGGPTVRTIESITRLSQAHARLMFRNTVKLFDVVSVILLIEFGLQGYSIGCKNGRDQMVDRVGLFPDIKSLFKDYVNDNKDNLDSYESIKYSLSNGIISQEMYNHFEELLFKRLKVTRVYSNPEELEDID